MYLSSKTSCKKKNKEDGLELKDTKKEETLDMSKTEDKMEKQGRKKYRANPG